MKSSTKNISSSLANLSIKTEHDGDSPESTLIHKSIVHFYDEQQGSQGYPRWLGEEENEKKRHSFTQSLQNATHIDTHLHQSHQQQQQHQHPQEYTNRSSSNSGTSRWMRKDTSLSTNSSATTKPSTSSTFKSIYNSSPEEASSHAAHHSNFPAGRLQSTSRSNSGSSLMRDRLKRNNQRTDFGV